MTGGEFGLLQSIESKTNITEKVLIDFIYVIGVISSGVILSVIKKGKKNCDLLWLCGQNENCTVSFQRLIVLNWRRHICCVVVHV